MPKNRRMTPKIVEYEEEDDGYKYPIAGWYYDDFRNSYIKVHSFMDYGWQWYPKQHVEVGKIPAIDGGLFIFKKEDHE
jgi:hypothetical protein